MAAADTAAAAAAAASAASSAAEPDFTDDVHVDNMMESTEVIPERTEMGLDQQFDDKSKRSKNSYHFAFDQSIQFERANHKRGGMKKRLGTAAYRQIKQKHGYIDANLQPVPFPRTLNSLQFPRVPSAYPVPRFPIQKFGFFNESTPSIHPGHPGSEKRSYGGPMKARLMMEGRCAPKASTHMINFPLDVPQMAAYSSFPQPKNLNETQRQSSSKSEMNELFAKMVWTKLDMVQSPTRLNRLHTEIMNILQQAIAEESASK